MPTDSTVQDLNELYTKARSARAVLEPVWQMNMAYFANEQWLAWNGNRLYRPEVPRNRILVTDNRITPAIRKEIARMTKQQPVFTVTPNTADEQDTNAAELGETVMRDLYKRLKLAATVGTALRWSRVCCAGFLKVFWDSTVGESTEVLVSQANGNIIQNPQTGAPLRPGDMPEMQQMPGVVVRVVSQGEICVEARSPFQMFPDPLVENFQDAEWLVEESVKSPDYVQRRYGVTLQPDTAAAPGFNGIGTGMMAMGRARYMGVRVREYWCKPNPNSPGGKRVVWALQTTKNRTTTGQILYEDDQPFDCQPYIMFSAVPVPGRLWPMSVVELLRGPQTELNKVESQIAENRSRVGNPTLLASKQAVRDPQKFVQSANQPGGVLFYDDVGSPNAKPDILPAPPLPDYVIQTITNILGSIEDISGQHEVSSAQVPPGVTAASAINLLQEADDTMLGPDMADFEQQLGYLGSKMLSLVARYYTDARTIRVAGDNGSWQIFDFRGAMLRDNTHVEVQAGSAFPQSKAAKQAWIQDLLTFLVQSGNPPQGRELAQFLSDSEIGGAERLVEAYTINEQQINRENVLLSQGQLFGINPYDDDQAHIDGHQDFQKSARYPQLPEQTQANIEGHVEMHKTRIEQQQAAAQAAAAPPPGQPGAPQPGGQLQLQMAAAQEQPPTAGQQFALSGPPPDPMAAAQGQQQLVAGAQQAGFQQAAQEQSQRHAEQLHQQRMQHAEDAHRARMAQSNSRGR